jgi:hypothetical protein
MKKFRFPFLMVLFLLTVFYLSSAAGVQGEKANDKILGEWAVEIIGGTEYYYVDLTFAETDGKLSGTASEKNGMFKDVLLTNVSFDGQTLAFDLTVASPPDGLEKTWNASFTVTEDKMDGSFFNDQAGSAPASATRQKK